MGDGGICPASATSFEQESKHSPAKIRCSELLVDVRHRDERRIVDGHTRLTNISTHRRVLTPLICESLNYATKEDIAGDGQCCEIPVPGDPAFPIRQVE